MFIVLSAVFDSSSSQQAWCSSLSFPFFGGQDKKFNQGPPGGGKGQRGGESNRNTQS